MMLESHFPSLFQIISGFFCAADLNLMTRWAGFPFPFWVLGSVDGFWAIFIHVLSTVDHWCCWALGSWWITEMLDLVHRGLKKNGPLQT
jgi:hypothetical protein